jgi:hypothetical protein
MSVRVIAGNSAEEPTPERDYLHVQVHTSPDDDTVTLATIQRYVEGGGDVDSTESTWRVRTLVADQPMTRDEAMGFATRYAERKHIPLVVTDRE